MGCSKKRIPIVVVVAALILLLGQFSARDLIAAEGRLPGTVIAVIPEDFPPTYFKNQQTGRADGFAVDVMDELARRSGLKVRYVFGKPWDEIMEMLSDGRADIVPVITIHEERQKVLAFTHTVATNPINLIIPSDNAKITAIIPGITVGAIKGSSAEDYLKKNGTIQLKSYNDMHTLLFELLAGRIDAALTATPIFMQIAYEARVDDKVKVIPPPVIEGKRALALRKEDTALLMALNKAIDEFVGSAEYQKIYVKWFGKPASFWTVEKVIWISGAMIFLLAVGMAFWRYRSMVLLNTNLRRSIAERVQAEAALRESEALQRQLLANLPAGVVIVDPVTRVIELANEYVAALFGAPPDQLKGRRCHSLLCPACEENCPICDLGQGVDTSDREMLRVDGSRIPVMKTVKRIQLNGHEKLLECFVDISDRKRAEQSLNEIRQQLENIFDFLPDATFVIDNDKKVIAWNRAMEEMSGISKEEMLGQGDHAYTIPFYGNRRPQLLDLLDVSDDEIKAKYKNVQKKGERLFAEAFAPALYGAKGAYIWMTGAPLYDSQGNRAGSVEAIRDISEIKQAEEEKLKLAEQLQQAQKMEAIGQLAGGVAHDFNNILQAISGFGHLLETHLKDNATASQYVANILLAAGRAAALTQSLLAFSRKQLVNPQPISLNAIIKNTEKILASLVGEDIHVRMQLTEQNTSTYADSNHVTQILLNLAANARDAMPKGGILQLKTERVFMDEAFIKERGHGLTGNYAVLIVTDRGIGMDEETKKRIFEPFFTTKEVGKGTGLGLSMVYGIVKQHNGFIDVESEAGEGTVFTIYLPAFDTEVEVREIDEHFEPEGATETLLVVEDNVMVRQALVEMLQAVGHTVIEACDGEDAVAEFVAHRSEIQLVLMDVIMPGKSGADAYRELKVLKPDLKIIFMSGYTGDYLSGSFGLEEDVPFISKPVSPKELFEKIRNVLDGETA